MRGSAIVRSILERGGDINAVLSNLPSARSGWKGKHRAYDSVKNNVADDMTFWASEAEANQCVAV